MKDEYIRFRCSAGVKSFILHRASELGLSLTDYIISCCYHDCYNSEDFSDLVMVPVSRKYIESNFK